jgi:predicted transcriptional regulator YheO
VDSDDPRVRMWSPVCQAVALLLGPYAEVVLHDAEHDRVLAIWNPLS